jgi:hypothetical protein
MGEVGEGGFGLDEARPNNESGGVVDGQGEDLELFSGPPLVRGAVVLEKIAIALARTLEVERLKANRRKSSSARKLKLAGLPVARVVRRKVSASSGQGAL